MATIYLGLGSNLGDRHKNIASAVECLNQNGITIKKLSTIIETDPVGGPKDQGKFLNAVAKAETNLSPENLRNTLKTIEQTLGRVKTAKNGPRTIDLDILLYDMDVVNTSELIIPHPRMLNRDFVMIPLKEIAPDLAEELFHASRQKR